MSWQPYRIVYRISSPVHIGYRTLGFIQRTRYYIPGRPLWGAITAAITRTCSSSSEFIFNTYKEVGDFVNQNIRLSYFYPAISPAEPLLPQFTSEGMKLGGYSQYAFESLFIRSFVQTAVEPETSTAEDASLHETEFISPLIEFDSVLHQVYLVGYFIVNEGTTIELNGSKRSLNWDGNDFGLKRILKEIFVGGERKYGFGRLILHSDALKLGKDEDGKYTMFEHKLIISDSRLQVEFEKNKPIPAHLNIESWSDLKGDVEPVVGRDFEQASNSHRLSESTVSWVPGSLLTTRSKFEIGQYGLLA